MSKVQKFLIEKDGVQAETTNHNLAALEKRGWTVVEDGNDSESGQEPAPVKGQSTQPPAATGPQTTKVKE